MIQFRESFFETNSSSCHVFIYNPKEGVSVPKTVTLIPNSDDSLLNVLFNDIYVWYRYDICDDMEWFIDCLYEMGVNTIKCSDEKVQTLIDERKEKHESCHFDKEAMKCIFFGTDTHLDVLEDWEDFQAHIDKKYGKQYKCYSLRLS